VSTHAVEDTTPILIGGGQLVQRDVDPAAALEPLAMMVEVARRAAVDAGAGDRLLAGLDAIAVVNILGWQYENAPRLLAERLGAHPREELYTTIGGNTPQSLVTRTAGEIAAGRIRLALLAGGEAFHTLQRARRTGVPLRWTTGGTGSPTMLGETRAGTHPVESAHGLHLPVQIYPMFDNALRARAGWSLAEHQRRLGALCSGLSAVAAQNPYAWFPRARTGEEIATPTPTNRMVGFPYTKYMNAIMDVDQAAGVLMTSVGHARALGIPRARWVYLRGAADAHDLWHVVERVGYAESPAIRAAGAAALAMAGVGIEDVAHFDFYSCFPSAVQLGRDALGIPADDPRPLTVTGGLPYAGGPGNNYTMHAIATMLDRLRAAPGSVGLVSGLGWYVTKHAIGVYATEPGSGPWGAPDAHALQAGLDATPHPALAVEPDGGASIETYTVVHDREGAPVRGFVIGRLADGARFVAHTPSDRTLLEGLVAREAIGVRGRVTHAKDTNTFVPD
jgi:acetyl-CoA C-acetyltransferase